ncbi:PLP-dependent transferase [Coniochaeta ligniaria NRRL 30616]|uniref:PLP-dependent transferase n=1 Tax=Coniochaeta ligniaria NRRL 30616 TaxID=1408157 RepID=A0A1J7JEE4_9PEZI|nr:PLP-dependent transferase [Coniochaeta ligniaria NRRL 30616]
MVKIEPFQVEQWMDRYETTPGVINTAETCVASVSINELVDLGEDKDAKLLDFSRPLTYSAIRGSDELRRRVAELVSKGASSPLSAENVLITQGAIGANFLLLYTLIGPGDHVVCVYPTYEQLYAVPEHLGAEVSLWKLKQQNGYVPDVSELETLVKSNTKLIILNNPNNPTGSVIPHSVLQDIVAFAKARGITILSDEVLPSEEDAPPSILSLGYSKTVATGSMSKAFALAGIRLGWIASRDKDVIEAVASARDYTTISVSQLDDQVAAYALSPSVLPSLMSRNMEIARTNLELLDGFVRKYSSVCRWVKPKAGTTALVQFRKEGEPVDDEKFVLHLLDRTKVLFLPACVCFGGGKHFKGFVRIGYACHTSVLREGLEKLAGYVEEHLS